MMIDEHNNTTKIIVLNRTNTITATIKSPPAKTTISSITITQQQHKQQHTNTSIATAHRTEDSQLSYRAGSQHQEEKTKATRRRDQH
jgi:hypothetical protein